MSVKTPGAKLSRRFFLTNISEAEAPEGLDKLGFERYIVKANLKSNELPGIVDQILGLIPPAQTQPLQEVQ